MLNHIVKAASGAVSHNALFDAMFGIERPDFMAKCPESYINAQFVEMDKIVDLKAFKKEAATGFKSMGLDTDIADSIVDSIYDAKTSVDVARVIYGAGIYLVTEVAANQPELKEVLTKRWCDENIAEQIKGDGFYTLEAEQAMMSLCRSVFEGQDADLVIEEPVKPNAEPVKAAEATVTTEPAPVKPQQQPIKKGNKTVQ